MSDLKDVIRELGLTMTAEFIPWSKSRNAKLKPRLSDRSLNWWVTLKRQDGVEMLTTEYSAGIAHCPSYKTNARETLEYAEKIEHETEVGKQALSTYRFGPKIDPSIADVVYSLVTDAEAIDYPTYEEWANELGYDADSRKSEAIYRECLRFGLALRAHLGETGLSKLREAAQDY